MSVFDSFFNKVIGNDVLLNNFGKLIQLNIFSILTGILIHPI